VNPIYIVVALAIIAVPLEWWIYLRAQSDRDNCIREWNRRAMSFSFVSESRDVASQRLESEIYASLNYAMLRRITGLAPLVGVILTAVSLATTGVESGQAISDSGGLGALVALRPVFWGVVLGATLSIVNQLLVVTFEAALRTRIRDSVDDIPADRFAGVHDVLGTFPEDLKQILATLSASQQTVHDLQSRTTEEMGRILTRVSGAVLELSDSAAKSGEKLRESAASHFDQVKVTTKEFGKTVGQLAVIVEKANEHLGGVLSAASDQLGDAQRAMAKSMQDIQVEAAKAVGRLDKQTDALNRGAEEALVAVRNAVDDSLQQHNRKLEAVLEARVREAASAVEDGRALMRASLGAAEEAIRRATGELSGAASGLGGLGSSIASLERQIRESGAQSESGLAAAGSLSRELVGLGASVSATEKALHAVTESIVARYSELAKRVDASEGRLDAVSMRLSDGILGLQREVEALSASSKSLVERSIGLAEQLKVATAKLGELHVELKEPEKRRGWTWIGGR
jgi:DNA anti-recombination protein RmuC